MDVSKNVIIDYIWVFEKGYAFFNEIVYKVWIAQNLKPLAVYRLLAKMDKQEALFTLVESELK